MTWLASSSLGGGDGEPLFDPERQQSCPEPGKPDPLPPDLACWRVLVPGLVPFQAAAQDRDTPAGRDEDGAAGPGYRLPRPAWGKGNATEGSRALAPHRQGSPGASRPRESDLGNSRDLSFVVLTN
jgi:hypothetical protein